MTEKKFKIVLIGPPYSGKTSIAQCYINQKFEYTIPTTSAAYFTKQLKINETTYTFNLWDTAGQEKFRSVASMYYRNANVFIIVVDPHDVQSYSQIDDWFSLINKYCDFGAYQCILAINKMDIEISNSTYDLFKDKAQQKKCQLIMCSAKANKGIEELFYEALQIAVNHDAKNVSLHSPNVQYIDKEILQKKDKQCC
ncbi:Rab1a [Hexamita inflata]|uniref:Rab1a n=1 Tax=Hexamita inflata TaxID=28002 RepID=A0AA86PUU8_9EUKA|nr:Rab1a [Hexamita inflata]